jgi:hypothetical protein
MADLKQEELLKDQPMLRGRRNALSTSTERRSAGSATPLPRAARYELQRRAGLPATDQESPRQLIEC